MCVRMQSTTIPNYQPAFGNIFTGECIKGMLRSPERTKKFEHQFMNIKKALHKQHYAKAEHVNAILDYSTCDGFYLAILNKHGRIPSSQKSPFFCNIVRTEKCINDLTEWVNYWDSLCGHKL